MIKVEVEDKECVQEEKKSIESLQKLESIIIARNTELYEIALDYIRTSPIATSSSYTSVGAPLYLRPYKLLT